MAGWVLGWMGRNGRQEWQDDKLSPSCTAQHTAQHSTAHTPQPTATHSKTQARSAIWAMGKGVNRGHLLPKSGGMGKPKGGDSESNKVQYSGVQHSTIVYTMLHIETAPSPACTHSRQQYHCDSFSVCMSDGWMDVCGVTHLQSPAFFPASRCFLLAIVASLLDSVIKIRSDHLLSDIRTTSPPETRNPLIHPHSLMYRYQTPPKILPSTLPTTCARRPSTADARWK